MKVAERGADAGASRNARMICLLLFFGYDSSYEGAERTLGRMKMLQRSANARQTALTEQAVSASGSPYLGLVRRPT